MNHSSQSPPSSVAARVDDCVFAVKKRIATEPRIGVVLGSGLGAFADMLDDSLKIPYRDLPHMPASGVSGHAGNLCFGRVANVPVVCMQGRVHLYEGHSIDKVVHGVRTMARLGVRAVLISNAAGGLEPSWSAGDLMVVTDHLNLTGTSPLVGPNDDTLGPRFPGPHRRLRSGSSSESPRRRPRRAHPAARRCVRRAARAFVRNARRSAHVANARRAGRRNEHGARGDRPSAHGGARRRAFVHYQSGRGFIPASPRSRRGRGNGALAT